MYGGLVEGEEGNNDGEADVGKAREYEDLAGSEGRSKPLRSASSSSLPSSSSSSSSPSFIRFLASLPYSSVVGGSKNAQRYVGLYSPQNYKGYMFIGERKDAFPCISLSLIYVCSYSAAAQHLLDVERDRKEGEARRHATLQRTVARLLSM